MTLQQTFSRPRQATSTKADAYKVLRPGRGPSDDEIERMLRIHQGGIAAFFYALRAPELSGAPKVIIEA